MRILVTGSAGFIGHHVAGRLLDRGDEVVGIDNLNAYYDVQLKQDRLARLTSRSEFAFERLDIADRDGVAHLFERYACDRVVHLAAQAGVRYSLQNPHAYVDSNLVGFVNVLEACRRCEVEHLVFASSSSVYGLNEKQPFSEHDAVDHPASLYAATKRSNELLAHTYAHLYEMPVTGLRFFTVYGPWGRPDMALFLFTRAIVEGRPISVFNNGDMRRDFTYVDDIVEGVIRVLDRPPVNGEGGVARDPAGSYGPYRIFNIGSGRPVELLRFIELIEQELGIEAKREFLPMQPGDIPESYCDVKDLEREVGYKPPTSIEDGVRSFVEWYCEYYEVRTGASESTSGIRERVEER